MTEPVVLINVFEVPAADAEVFIAGWETTRDYFRSQPGYVDTALHRSIAPGAEFQFVNVAHWRTAEDFAAAIAGPGFLEATKGLGGYRSHPALYRVART